MFISKLFKSRYPNNANLLCALASQISALYASHPERCTRSHVREIGELMITSKKTFHEAMKIMQELIKILEGRN